MRLSPFLDGFRDELEKIALMGKVIGGGLAAGAGYGAFRLARGAKRTFHDDLKEKDEAALHGYTPYAVRAQQASPYGPNVF